MGICWSDIPPPQPQATYQACLSCRKWENTLRMNNQYCEECIRKFTIAAQQQQPYPQQQYTYATMPYPQQQQQQYIYAAMPYQQPQQQYYPPQQRSTQMGTGTAVVGGFVLGAMVENMLDPSD